MEDKIPQESGLTIVDEIEKIFGSRILDEWRF